MSHHRHIPKMDVASGSEPPQLKFNVPPSPPPPRMSPQSEDNSPAAPIPTASADCTNDNNSDVNRHLGDDDEYEMEDLCTTNFSPPPEVSLFLSTSSPARLSSPSPDPISPLAPAERDQGPFQPPSTPNIVMLEPCRLLDLYPPTLVCPNNYTAHLHTRLHFSFRACSLTLFCLSHFCSSQGCPSI
jgi:hypothetical protein